MKRKIIQLGSATLVASLPSKWARQYGLKPGDEIDIEEEESRLIIRTKKDFGIDKKELDISKLSPMITYAIMSMYVKGVDELEIRSDDPKLLELLHHRPLPQLLGYEIINQGKNHLQIKDLTGVKEFDFNTIARRIFLLLKQMSEEIIKAVENKDTDLSHIWSLEQSVNKFSWLSMRIINKRGIEPKKNAVLFNILNNLEEIGDLFHKFAKYVLNKRIKFSKESIDFMKEVSSLLDDYQTLFFKFSQESAAKFDKKFRDLASTPGGRMDKSHKMPDSKFDKVYDKVSREELRPLFMYQQIAEHLGENARNQLIIDL